MAGAAPAAPKPLRPVCILGTASSTRPLAPAYGGEWEIWSVGMLSQEAGNYDRFYEIHDPALFRHNFADYYDWLTRLKCPVVGLYDLPDVPTAVRYPREAVAAHFGGEWFLTSSIAWMLAQAIFEGRPGIGLWGVEMASGSEYAEQKAGCLHFISLARLAGITVTIPPESELAIVGKPYPFNYEDPMQRRVEQHLKTCDRQLGQVREQILHLRLGEARLEGQIEALQTVQRTLITPV